VQTLASMTNLDVRRGAVEAAIEHGAQAWNAAQKLPDNHPMAAYAAVMYGQALLAGQRLAEAQPLIERALSMRKAKFPPDHPLIANTESLLGLVRAQTGDRDGGEALARAAHDRLLAKLGAAHELTVLAQQRLEQIEALPQAPSRGR